jgi:phage-related minor tail protein
MLRTLPLRFRRPFRHLFVGVAIVAGAVLALAGAVVALFVLAVGALAHAAWTGLRTAPRAVASAHRDARVIEGEYAVVGRPPRAR